MQPYKLVNHSGIWYLAARDGARLKSYTFSKMESLQVGGDTFTPDPAVHATLVQEDSVWMSERKTEVLLKVAREAAGYFRRRKLVAGQVIEKELEGGGLLVSCRVAHANEILPIVRYWIPSVRIVSPEGLQAKMKSEIQDYLKIKCILNIKSF